MKDLWNYSVYQLFYRLHWSGERLCDLLKVTHLNSCRAQNIPKISHLTQGRTKGLTMASKSVLVKVLKEVNGTHKGLTEESIIMGPFTMAWIALKKPIKEVNIQRITIMRSHSES